MDKVHLCGRTHAQIAGVSGQQQATSEAAQGAKQRGAEWNRGKRHARTGVLLVGGAEDEPLRAHVPEVARLYVHLRSAGAEAQQRGVRRSAHSQQHVTDTVARRTAQPPGSAPGHTSHSDGRYQTTGSSRCSSLDQPESRKERTDCCAPPQARWRRACALPGRTCAGRRPPAEAKAGVHGGVPRQRNVRCRARFVERE